MVIARFLRRFRFRRRFGRSQAQTGFETKHEHVGDDYANDKEPVARRESFVKEEHGSDCEHNHSHNDDGSLRPQRPDAGASSIEPDEKTPLA